MHASMSPLASQARSRARASASGAAGADADVVADGGGSAAGALGTTTISTVGADRSGAGAAQDAIVKAPSTNGRARMAARSSHGRLAPSMARYPAGGAIECAPAAPSDITRAPATALAIAALGEAAMIWLSVPMVVSALR
jgi:hypothetical protein